MFRYSGIWCCRELVIIIKSVSLPNKTSMTKLLTVFTVELVGARKLVCGFAMIFLSTFSLVILLFENDSIALPLILWIRLFDGNPIRKEPTK